VATRSATPSIDQRNVLFTKSSIVRPSSIPNTVDRQVLCPACLPPPDAEADLAPLVVVVQVGPMSQEQISAASEGARLIVEALRDRASRGAIVHLGRGSSRVHRDEPATQPRT
jgi:hypothetical protein